MSEGLTFEQWFEGEKQNGLVDIKLAISTSNAAGREIEAELVSIESKIKSGLMMDAMQLNGDCDVHPDAKMIIGSCLFK